METSFRSWVQQWSTVDLSKAFDVLNHSLFLAYLGAYGFSLKSTTFIQSYLNKRMEKVNVNNKFSA